MADVTIPLNVAGEAEVERRTTDVLLTWEVFGVRVRIAIEPREAVLLGRALFKAADLVLREQGVEPPWTRTERD